ncbi:MAG: hypothetical protein KatS3mg115_2385 [Candidatus Poribacteria bacterium]|nr:MAG: hypothetical protein KatS3mg115_2385 [Candidatus Poribacteria bacterium]
MRWETLGVVQEIAQGVNHHWRSGRRTEAVALLLRFLSGHEIARRLAQENQDYWGWLLRVTALMLLAHTFLLAIWGRRVRAAALVLGRRPLGPILYGLLVLLLVPPFSWGLYRSGVGIPPLLTGWGILYGAALWGKTALLYGVGSRLLRQSGSPKLWPFYPAYGLYAALVAWDPLSLGAALFLVVNLLGIGLALRTGFGWRLPSN